MAKVAVLPLELIEENPQALRTTVDKDDLAYQELKAGIANVGLLNPISVREFTKEDGTVGYRLVDGLHRKTAFQDLGIAEIPVNIVTVEDSKLLVAQIVGNQSVKTTKTQFAQALKQLMQHDGLTLKEVATLVSRNEKWVGEQLNLLNLPQSVQTLLDDGKICLQNAQALLKVKDHIEDFLQGAMTESWSTFVPKVEAAAKEFRKAALQGRQPNKGFQPVAKARKPGEVKELLAEYENTGTIGKIKTLIETQGITSPLEAAVATIKWALSLDPVSVAAEKALYDADKAQREADKAKREAEAKAKKEAQAKTDVQNALAA